MTETQSTDLTVTCKELKQIFKVATINNQQILVTGNIGIGKSAVFQEAMDELKKEKQLLDYTVDISSIADPTDYKGLPFAEKGIAHFLPLGIIKRAIESKRKLVVLLDDLGQAPFSVQSALMQVIHGRKLNGYTIPDHVVFHGATNRKKDKSNVHGLIEPLKGRFHSIVNLTPDVETWVEWAFKNNVSPEVIAFIRFRPEFLTQIKNTIDITNQSNPRNIEHASDIYKANYGESLLYNLISGACGQGFASEFMAFLKLYRELPDIDSILLNPTKSDIPTEPATLYAVTMAIASKATESNMDKVVIYACRLQPEFSVLLIKNASLRNKKLTATKAFIKWAKEHEEYLL